MEFLSKASFVVLKAEQLAFFGWHLARSPREGSSMSGVALQVSPFRGRLLEATCFTPPASASCALVRRTKGSFSVYVLRFGAARTSLRYLVSHTHLYSGWEHGAALPSSARVLHQREVSRI